MKVLVFADPNWSVGRVHHDVERYLINIQFIYIDWTCYVWDDFIQKFEE